MLAAMALVATACDSPRPDVATHVDDWRDQVIYEIVVDRFDDADDDSDAWAGVGPVPNDLARWQGGDWRGITRRLDYLAGMGVTTLWISPIVAGVARTEEADGYHGYWAADFTRLEPRFGDLEALRELVDEAHARGMTVIVDVVVNHTGRVFAYDLDGDGVVDADGGELEPAYRPDGPYDAPLVWLEAAPPALWRGDPLAEAPEVMPLEARHFHRRGSIADFGDPAERELGDFPDGLRDLDTDDPEIVAALVDTWARWVALTDVDGMRLDAVPHAPTGFWAAFSTGLRAWLAVLGKRRFLLLGEVWNADPAVLAPYVAEGGLDAVLDFTFKWRVLDDFVLDGAPAASVVPALTESAAAYPPRGAAGGVGLTPWQARVVFADNHDLRRVRAELDDPWAAELALTMVFTVDAIPCVYYGTEQGMTGGSGHAAREPLWPRGFDEGHRTYRHIARLAALRRAHPALRRGSLVVRHASAVSAREQAPDAGLLVWERAHDGDRVLVALNGHPTDVAGARVPTGFPPGTVLVDELGRGVTLVVDEAGAVTLAVPPREAMILTVAP
jgi:glycosidase